MSNVLHSRLFRFLVCFLVICCILVNLSPLKAEATAVVGTLLTFEGLMAALFSMAIGVVAVDLSVETWNRIGQDLGEEVANADSSIVEAWVDVEALYNSYGPDDDDPEDALEWAEKLKKALSVGLLSAIAGWLCTLVNIGGYEVDGEAATDGWSYYGDILLPTIPTEESYPYITITSYSYGYRIYRTTEPFFDLSSEGSNYLLRVKNRCSCSGTLLDYDSLSSWSSSSSYSFSVETLSSSKYHAYNEHYIWSNYDILANSDGSTLVFTGSEPTSTKTEIIEPSIYVGDIPQQIQDGDKDKDNLNLPIIDPFKLIQKPGTALDDVNQMQQALKDGTITIDDYLQQVQVQDQADTEDPSNPTEDPSETTDPTVAVDPWEPPEDPGQFALDLSEVFPFCIPFDLYDFLSLLNADPVAPVINWEIALPGGGSYPLQIDLSPFDSVAQLLRRLQLLLFIVALGIKTRDLIKG